MHISSELLELIIFYSKAETIMVIISWSLSAITWLPLAYHSQEIEQHRHAFVGISVTSCSSDVHLAGLNCCVALPVRLYPPLLRKCLGKRKCRHFCGRSVFALVSQVDLEFTYGITEKTCGHLIRLNKVPKL